MKKEIKVVILFTIITASIAISSIPRAHCQDSFWNTATQWGNSIGSQISQSTGDGQNSISNWGQDIGDAISDWSNSAQDQVDQWSSQAGDQVKDWANQAQDFAAEASQDIGSALERAKQLTGSYREEAFSILGTEAKRQLCEEYGSAEAVGELQRRRGFLTEATIAAVKFVPIYDEQEGQVHTFDQFARNLCGEIPGVQGSDLADDPARCAALMVLDGDYLMYAKIIKTSDGNWMSMDEALTNGYRTSEVTSAKSDLIAAQAAYRNEDAQQTQNYVNSFSAKVCSINEPVSSTTDNSSDTYQTETTQPNSDAQINTQADPVKEAFDTINIACVNLYNAVSVPPIRWYVLIGLVGFVAIVGMGLVARKKNDVEEEYI